MTEIGPGWTGGACSLLCGRCGGPAPEFTVVPNELWNLVVRRGGPEGCRGSEYLCAGCYRDDCHDLIQQLVSERDAAERRLRLACDRACGNSKPGQLNATLAELRQRQSTSLGDVFMAIAATLHSYSEVAKQVSFTDLIGGPRPSIFSGARSPYQPPPITKPKPPMPGPGSAYQPARTPRPPR